MPQTGYCTDLTCTKELTELYECHCCSWLICLKHLLEHVEISKRDKKILCDNLRNELTSITYTLELMVQKKTLEIEGEKQLMDKAKTVLDKSECTFEEIRSISDEINQVIQSNRKEETIVKVEPLLSDANAYSYNNGTTTDTLTSANFSSSTPRHSSNDRQSKSPTYQNMRYGMNDPWSVKVNHSASVSSVEKENIEPNVNKSNDKRRVKKSKAHVSHPCPLTFDGAFGLTESQDSIKLCPIDYVVRSNLVGHLMLKHKMQKPHARRIYQATQGGKDPRTTKLFQDHEVVTKKVERILCPFHNKRIHLIECCPTQSRRVPCLAKPIENLYLISHLKAYHRLPADIAREIAENYREKLAKISSSTNENDSPH